MSGDGCKRMNPFVKKGGEGLALTRRDGGRIPPVLLGLRGVQRIPPEQQAPGTFSRGSANQ